MARPARTTRPLLDVAACLLKADIKGEELHGWKIISETKRTGPTVYGILDRLEDMRWITGYWEKQSSGENRPRRRFYRLTEDGRSQVRELLAERRPDELRQLAEPARPGLRLPRRSVAPGGAQ
jgi:PadR family transcriptional regulator, regulatory protein PadR